nr:melanoma-derived growth regulatory protein isoform X1 [Vulpes vulpes]
MELNISTCLSGPLMVEVGQEVGVAVTWSGLGCFGPIWTFSWAGCPHPVFEMVLAGQQPLAPSVGGRAMPKLADRKLCADEECSYPISMAVALQDYVAPDCRFLTIHRGQVVYVFSKLKGRGRLFWGGSVQGDYYGDLAARLGYFPSSVVREDQTLKPGKIDVKTDKWDFYCQ